MKKIILVFVVLGFASMLKVPSIWSADDMNEETVAVSVPKAVDAGNKICPVTGEKIDEKTKVTYEYQGKIYNFCCAGCPEQFKKDPEKYIKKVNEELRAGSEEKPTTKMIMPETGMPEDMPASSHGHHGH